MKPAGRTQQTASGIPLGAPKVANKIKKPRAQKKKEILDKLAKLKKGRGGDVSSPRSTGLKRIRSGEENSPNYENHKRKDTGLPQAGPFSYTNEEKKELVQKSILNYILQKKLGDAHNFIDYWIAHGCLKVKYQLVFSRGRERSYLSLT